MDSDQLEKGQKVEELFLHIQKSIVFVPFFSKGYANPEWCLKEVAKSVECKKLIIPVFFGAEPRDVRRQTGPFASAFTRYLQNEIMDKEVVRKWRDALRGAGEVSGYNLSDAEGDEEKLIQLNLKRILAEVNRPALFVAKHLVRLDYCSADVKKMLDVEALVDVRMVGIHGMGGMGNLTLVAKFLLVLIPVASFI